MSYQTFYGPDISAYQTVISWPELNNGAAWIMIKASGNDAGNYIDTSYQQNITNARVFGNSLPRIVYNYCGGVDPINDADYFVDNVLVNLEVGEGYEFDCERGAAVTPEYALQALNQAKSRAGWGGGVYVSQNRLVTEDWSAVANAGYFVHPADWGVAPSGTFSVGAFKTYPFQQYTDNATWPGISAPCDGDVFFGEVVTDILKFGKPAPIIVPPRVNITPPAAPVVVTVPAPAQVQQVAPSEPTVHTITSQPAGPPKQTTSTTNTNKPLSVDNASTLNINHLTAPKLSNPKIATTSVGWLTRLWNWILSWIR